MQDGKPATPARSDLPIRCRCGAVRGTARGVSPSSAYRVVCYCDDCQAFGNHLQASNARPILDAHGGTDICQMSSARLSIDQGADQLRCLRVTPKGPFRWYTQCCNTPIGNTLPTSQLPFVGLIHSCIDTRERTLDQMLGPVRLRVMARYAKGDRSELDAKEGFALSQIARFSLKLLKWRLRGDHKRSPFFDPESGEPVAAPQVLSDDGLAS